MEIGATGAPGGKAENWSRRDGIRAGAVSGPWRSAAPSPAAGAGGAGHAELMDDIPAPVLRAAGAPVAPRRDGAELALGPVLLEEDFSDLVADPRLAGGPAPAPRPSVLGAVLLGVLIAGAIVLLAFLLRS